MALLWKESLLNTILRCSRGARGALSALEPGQEGSRRPLPELLMGQDCSQREAPSVALLHVLLGPLV